MTWWNYIKVPSKWTRELRSSDWLIIPLKKFSAVFQPGQSRKYHSDAINTWLFKIEWLSEVRVYISAKAAYRIRFSPYRSSSWNQRTHQHLGVYSQKFLNSDSLSLPSCTPLYCFTTFKSMTVFYGLGNFIIPPRRLIHSSVTLTGVYQHLPQSP